MKLTLALGLFWHITACLYTLLSVCTIYASHVDHDPSDHILHILSSDVAELLSRRTLELPFNASHAARAKHTTHATHPFHTGMIIDGSTDAWHMPEAIWRYGPFARYLYAVSWAIAVTCQTMRPEPNTFLQLIMSDVVSVSGLFLMTGIIGAATAAIAEMQAQRSETTRLLQRIAQYMRNKRLPRDLRRRVLSFYQFHQSSMNILDNEDVLIGLPRAMRMQINLLMHKPVFVKLPLFWLCTEEEMLLIVQRLRPCLIMPGEMMLKEGTIGAGLFLLMKGAVETTSSGELLVVLLAVAAFGEAALQSEEASTVTIRALRFCETSLLTRADWLVIERLNPRIRTWLDIYINERDRKIRDPTVKNQSQQTKNATIRCGNGVYRDWNDVSNVNRSMRSRLQMKARAAMHARKLAREMKTRTQTVRRQSKEVLSTMKDRSMSICSAIHAFSSFMAAAPSDSVETTTTTDTTDSCDGVHAWNDADELHSCAPTRKLERLSDDRATPRDEIRNSDYSLPGLVNKSKSDLLAKLQATRQNFAA